MKQIIYILTFLTLGQLCFGQEKSFYVPTYGVGDTSLWFKWQQEKFKKCELKNLTKSTDTLHFRFASETQAVDIWTTNYLTFSGTLTNFTESYDSDQHKRKKPVKESFYCETKQLDTSKVRQVYCLFKSLTIFELPPQESIKDWIQGLDGITYFIECSTPTSYSFKNYWTPSIFKNKVEEAKRFYELTKELENLLGLRKSFNQFVHTLPKGTYTGGGLSLITTSKTKGKRNERKPNQ